MDDDPDKSEECLKSALWFAVGKIVDEAALERNINASPQFIGALSEMVWMQIESVATDIENFAHVSRKHGVYTG
jgi:centromere protein S